MEKAINKVIGDMNEKKRYHANEQRAKALPAEYTQAYNDIKHYLWNTSGLLTIEPLISLVDLLEEAATSGKTVIEVTGNDVAAFADELTRDESSYKKQQSEKLNDTFNK